MTKRERVGLDLMIAYAPEIEEHDADIAAAMDWIKRQMSLDERRRKRRKR